jgi:predicted GNAT family N-acyltransferase
MIRVTQVKTKKEFEKCLELRYEVYHRLGYLKHKNKTDLDEFDWSSFHFAALREDGEPVAVVRLAVPASLVDQVDQAGQLRDVGKWCDDVNQRYDLGIVPSRSIPIWDTLQQNDISFDRLHSQRVGEMSRIIVSSKHRGCGISHQLADLLYKNATQLGCTAVVLQCLSDHVHFFEKLGYRKLFESLVYEHLSVPERVIAMQRDVHPNATEI